MLKKFNCPFFLTLKHYFNSSKYAPSSWALGHSNALADQTQIVAIIMGFAAVGREGCMRRGWCATPVGRFFYLLYSTYAIIFQFDLISVTTEAVSRSYFLICLTNLSKIVRVPREGVGSMPKSTGSFIILNVYLQ